MPDTYLKETTLYKQLESTNEMGWYIRDTKTRPTKITDIPNTDTLKIVKALCKGRIKYVNELFMTGGAILSQTEIQ